MSRRVIAYIDGFNLYHGLKQAHGRRYHWLDLERMCAQLLQPDQRLQEVKYFTSVVRNDPPALARQQAYWNALRAETFRTDILLGRFQEKKITCRRCRNSWRSYEEKETDVNIAVAMVEDAARRRFETALIVSGDSDLVPAIESVRRLRPSTSIVVAFPPKRGSGGLRNAADASFVIRPKAIKTSQMPPAVTTAGGVIINRPGSWR